MPFSRVWRQGQKDQIADSLVTIAWALCAAYSMASRRASAQLTPATAIVNPIVDHETRWLDGVNTNEGC